MANYQRGNISFDQIRDGGAVVRTVSYTAVEEDAWTLQVFNSASALTLTLPNPPPSILWRISAVNIGAGTLTVSPNGLNLNGSASSASATTGQGIVIATDGINYFAETGGAAAGGGGGGGSALTQLAKTQLGSPAASITFSGISGAYNSLLLTFVGRSATAANFDVVTMQFNADSGNNYGREFISAEGTSLSSGSQTAVSSILAAVITAANATANYPGAVKFELLGYKDTTFTKTVLAYGGMQDGNFPVALFPIFGTWNNTAAITQITLALSSAANFVTGTTAILYGLN